MIFDFDILFLARAYGYGTFPSTQQKIQLTLSLYSLVREKVTYATVTKRFSRTSTPSHPLPPSLKRGLQNGLPNFPDNDPGKGNYGCR